MSSIDSHTLLFMENGSVILGEQSTFLINVSKKKYFLLGDVYSKTTIYDIVQCSFANIGHIMSKIIILLTQKYLKPTI